MSIDTTQTGEDVMGGTQVKEDTDEVRGLVASVHKLDAERADLARRLEAESSAHLQTIEDRDHGEEIVTRIAENLGCDKEWSNLHSHWSCVASATQELLSENESLNGALDAKHAKLVEIADKLRLARREGDERTLKALADAAALRNVLEDCHAHDLYVSEGRVSSELYRRSHGSDFGRVADESAHDHEVSMRDAVSGKLGGELLDELRALRVVAEAAERVCLLHEWDTTYRGAPSFTPGSHDDTQSSLVDAITKARSIVTPSKAP
jgi:hypothetical protein